MHKPELLKGIEARLERADRHLSKAAVVWLEIVAAGDRAKDLRPQAQLKALGEYWRRDQLRRLWAEVRAMPENEDFRDRLVMFFALDACDPPTIPSFKEWLGERQSSPPPPA